jgi:hypothetical protein
MPDRAVRQGLTSANTMPTRAALPVTSVMNGGTSSVRKDPMAMPMATLEIIHRSSPRARRLDGTSAVIAEAFRPRPDHYAATRPGNHAAR